MTKKEENKIDNLLMMLNAIQNKCSEYESANKSQILI